MTDQLTPLAVAAVQRYQSLLSTFRGQYQIALLNDPTKSNTRADAWSVLLDASGSFLSAESQQLDTDTRMVALSAVNDVFASVDGERQTKLTDFIEQHIEQTAHFVSKTFAAQVERDMATLMNEISHAAMRVQNGIEAGQSKVFSVLTNVNADTSVDFRFVDRIGRRYKSTKHIRDLYRWHLLTTYCEVFVHTAASLGFDTVEVVHPDSNFSSEGMLLSVVEGGQHPSFYDIQSEVFHPTSQASLRVVKSS